MEKVRAVITGATGMIGEGVLAECLRDERVERVLVVGRRSCGVRHPKLEEALLEDFFDLSAIEARLAGWNACFFCLGVSSVGMDADEYRRLTYDLTLNFARALAARNEALSFCYVSGSGTDSTESGRLAWARVKGRTENDLAKLPFRGAYAFRIGFVRPDPNARNTLGLYRFVGWLYPLVRAVSDRYASTLGEIGRAMIECALAGYAKRVLEVEDIVALARRQTKPDKL